MLAVLLHKLSELKHHLGQLMRVLANRWPRRQMFLMMHHTSRSFIRLGKLQVRKLTCLVYNLLFLGVRVIDDVAASSCLIGLLLVWTVAYSSCVGHCSDRAFTARGRNHSGRGEDRRVKFHFLQQVGVVPF